MKEFKNKIIGFVNSIITVINTIGNVFDAFLFGDQIKSITKLTPVGDFKSGPGQITHMMGPAGSFRLNPRDSVMGTTNRINDFQTGPAGSMGSPGLADAIDRNTRALTNMQLTAGRGEIRVAMEPQLGGALA